MTQTSEIQFVHVNGGSAIDRIVYDLKFIAEQKMQVGYIKLNGRRVPVFRAYDPENLSKGASWRKNYWSEIYEIKAAEGLENVSVRGFPLVLPNVCFQASSGLIVHLNSVLRLAVPGYWKKFDHSDHTDNVVDFPKHV